MFAMQRTIVCLNLVLTICATQIVTAQDCPLQVEQLYPGGHSNISIPNPNCFNARWQFSDGGSNTTSVESVSCANTNNKSLLALGLGSQAPLGGLNLTIFCKNLAPLCYSFGIGPPTNESRPSSGNTVRSVCPSSLPSSMMLSPSSLGTSPLETGSSQGSAMTGLASPPAESQAMGTSNIAGSATPNIAGSATPNIAGSATPNIAGSATPTVPAQTDNQVAPTPASPHQASMTQTPDGSTSASATAGGSPLVESPNKNPTSAMATTMNSLGPSAPTAMTCSCP